MTVVRVQLSRLCNVILSLKQFSHWCFFLFNAKAFPKSTGSTVGHTRVECVVCCPTLRDSSVTTGNYTLHCQDSSALRAEAADHCVLKLQQT